MNAASSLDLVEDTDIVTDTVGVICMDRLGSIAVGSSSGGVTMKSPGRVGPAAIVGHGSWTTEKNGKKLAVCCSGMSVIDEVAKF